MVATLIPNALNSRALNVDARNVIRQKQLIRRAATLSIMAEAMEADAVRNLAFDGRPMAIALAVASSALALSARRGT